MRNAILLAASFVIATSVLPCRSAVADENPADTTKLDVLDVIPAAASAAVAVRNASELSIRGDEFIAKTRMSVPMRFSDAFRFLLSILGIKEGVDKQGALALMAFGSEPTLEGLVLAIPVKDFDQMASNFAIPRDQIVPGKTIDLHELKQGKRTVTYVRYLAVRGRHVFVGFEEEPVGFAASVKTLRDELPPDVRQTLAADDILIYGSSDLLVSLMGKNDPLTEGVLNLIAGRADEATKQAMLQEVKRLTIGIRLDKGVGTTMMLDFAGDRSREVLTRLADGNSNASLAGLPNGQILAAQALSSRGEDMAELARSLIGLLLDELVFESGQIISSTRRSSITDLFGLGWQRSDETRVALYENRDPIRDGWFSLVAILDTDGAEQFVKDMVDLAPFMHASGLTVADVKENLDAKEIERLVEGLGHNSFRVRRLAALKLTMVGTAALPALQKAYDSSDLEVRERARSIAQQINRSLASERESLLEKDLLLRLRPQLTYVPKQETRAGRPVDFVRLGLRSKSDTLVARLRRLLGPQWNTIRVATVNNQVILLVGSDLSLMDSALASAQAEEPQRSVLERFAAFEKRASPNQSGQLHLSLARLEQLVDENTDPISRPDKATSTTSLGLMIAPQRIRVDLFAPFEEAQVVVQQLGW